MLISTLLLNRKKIVSYLKDVKISLIQCTKKKENCAFFVCLKLRVSMQKKDERAAVLYQVKMIIRSKRRRRRKVAAANTTTTTVKSRSQVLIF